VLLPLIPKVFNVMKGKDKQQIIMKNKADYYCLIAPITIFAIAFRGYRFATSDQHIYIPLMRRMLDSALYPGDYLFQQPSGKYSIWLPIVAYLSKLFTLRWVFFTGYLIAIFALFFVIYKLAYSLFENRDIACIAVLLLSVSRTQDQAVIMQETFFTLQPVAMPFGLMALSYFIQGRYTRACVFNAIAFLIHPIIATPPFLVLSIYLIFSLPRLGLKRVLKAFGAFALVMVPFFIIAFAFRDPSGFKFTGFFKVASKEWMSILYGRNSYAFPALWSRSSWERVISIGILLVSSIFLKIMYSGIDKREFKAIWIAIVSLGTVGLAYLFGTKIPLPMVFQLQIARGFFMFLYMAFIYAAYVIWTGS